MGELTGPEGQARPPRDTLGMSAEELMAYLEELLVAEAAEAAALRGTTAEEELASPGFASARAASSYAVKLIAANNAFVARFLLDQGILPRAADAPDGPPATPAG